MLVRILPVARSITAILHKYDYIRTTYESAPKSHHLTKHWHEYSILWDRLRTYFEGLGQCTGRIMNVFEVGSSSRLRQN